MISDWKYSADVVNSFKELNLILDKLTSAIISDNNLPAWFLVPAGLELSSKLTLREKVITFLKQLTYLDWQTPKEILIGAGVLAASPATIQIIEKLNAQKVAFKSSVLALKLHNAKFKSKDLNELLMSRPSELNKQLKRMGLARLHLKQCYRKIPLLLTKPHKMSWTWSATRAITKIKAADAYKLLAQYPPSFNIEQQHKKLDNLDRNTPLAIIQDSVPHLRVNIVDTTLPKARKMLKGSMPIFYLNDGSKDLPLIKPPIDKNNYLHKRLMRSDVKINPEVFLPTIHAHCYL